MEIIINIRILTQFGPDTKSAVNAAKTKLGRQKFAACITSFLLRSDTSGALEQDLSLGILMFSAF